MIGSGGGSCGDGGGIFQYNGSVSRDMPVQNIQLVATFQYNMLSQWGYFSTKHSVSRDIPVQIIQLVGILQLSQWGYSSTMIPLVGTFQCQMWSQYDMPVPPSL